jgi:predicted deacetylase
LNAVRALCVSIHDVAPRTVGACREITDAIARIDPTIPLTLLVVPRYHGDPNIPETFGDWIGERLARGDELALHGFTHLDEASACGSVRNQISRRFYTAGEGEFAALTLDEAHVRIARGRAWFEERHWPLHGFVAPAWLMSPETWDALDDFDFLYTTTLSQFHILKPRASLHAPVVVYSARSAWRRLVSRGWNASLALATRAAPIVRVGLHPADVAHPALLRHALQITSDLARRREAVTKSELARRVLRSHRAQRNAPAA